MSARDAAAAREIVFRGRELLSGSKVAEISSALAAARRDGVEAGIAAAAKSLEDRPSRKALHSVRCNCAFCWHVRKIRALDAGAIADVPPDPDLKQRIFNAVEAQDGHLLSDGELDAILGAIRGQP